MSLMSIDTPFITASALTPTRSRGLKRKSEEGSIHFNMMREDFTSPSMPQAPQYEPMTLSHSISLSTPSHTLPSPMCDNNAPSSPHSSKHQKVGHCTLQVEDAKCTRVKFAPGIILSTKKLYQEPWGVLVSSMEDYPPLQIKIGQRYWAKWDGMSCPFSCRPILQAIHSVADSSQVFESS